MTEPAVTVSRGAWWWWALVSVGVSAVTVATIHLTRNVALFPGLALLSSLVVPGAVLAYVVGRVGAGTAGLAGVAVALLFAAFGATVVAAVAEWALFGDWAHAAHYAAARTHPHPPPPTPPWKAALASLVEESAKLACVLAAGRGLWRTRRGGALDGLVLGVAAGAGFAVVESAGYTFTAFLADRGALSLPLHIAVLRGTLSPMGHVAWSGLLGASWFFARQHGRWGVAAWATAGVLALHAAWDAFPAALKALGVMPPPFVDHLLLALVVGVPGLAALLVTMRRAASLPPASLAASASPPVP